jgi:hypothetical protein
MHETGRNFTSGITFDNNNELHDPNFLKGGVTFTKLRRLVPFSGQFSLCMHKIGHNSTSDVVSNITINSANA